MATHVLAGAGVYTDEYIPPITRRTREHRITSDIVFAPAIPTDLPPSVQLQAAHLSGSSTESCTGPVENPQSEGTLTWSDGTTSSISLISQSAERVEGHPICHSTWTVTSGHYAEGTVHTLAVALASDDTACLAGGSIHTATGSVVIILTLP
ncbi:hypothetical protein [Streptomyces coffeae]|uniref:Ig-like domain-containing protein n=1 Tax=Streptomyces coffeae TaxID=621382 RepID=A0ABS1NRS5_9ACTN|nr:hypothetical protein [Streptomyces coffeae]MBL1102714.1 hypothetical protein [Streptomyces coffeae]